MTLSSLVHQIKTTIRPSFWLTPLNLREEREKFFKTGQDPRFIYPQIPLDLLNKHLTSLHSVELPEPIDLVSHLDRQRVEEIRAVIIMLLRRGTDDFSASTQSLYGCTFENKYLDAATEQVKINVSFKDIDTATVSETKAVIQKYLDTLGLVDWSLKIVPHTSFYFRILPKKQAIYISDELRWDFSSLDSTIAHEIDGHVLRAANMKQSNIVALRHPTPFYIRTEEGLASYLMDYHSDATEPGLKHHAVKYLAGSLARSASFAEVFDFCVQHGFSKELAFLRTQKLKRGLSDTSQPGLFAKEAVYYEGMLDVKEYIDSGKSIAKLYSGKVGLIDLPFIPTTEALILPSRLMV